jgi:hypothetical protein
MRHRAVRHLGGQNAVVWHVLVANQAADGAACSRGANAGRCEDEGATKPHRRPVRWQSRPPRCSLSTYYSLLSYYSTYHDGGILYRYMPTRRVSYRVYVVVYVL